METVLAGVATFTGVVIALVVVLMAARSRLVASGDVKILINGDPDKALTTAAGSTLLSTLADNQIFIAKAGAIPPLVQLATSGTAGQKEYAAGALKSLAVNADNKIAIAKAGGRQFT